MDTIAMEGDHATQAAIQALRLQLQQLHQQALDWYSRFPDETESLLALPQELDEKLNHLITHDTMLSIGVMGQVNAGKSSFLNALLFEGQAILPESSIPSTANLTRITYGEQPRLTVHYYSLAEWKEIEQHAESGGKHAEARAGRELLALVKRHRLDVESILTQQHEQHEFEQISDLLGCLQDYVADEGRYTPLVKMAELHLPLIELKGIEIVDTPGITVPLPCRAQKTREYMAACDVVFFLSRCDRFLNRADINLLTHQLPAKGVKRMVLVASQFDQALLNEGFNCFSLRETERKVLIRQTRRAEETLENLASEQECRGESEYAALLRSLKQPLFSSMYAHIFTSLPEEQWDRAQKEMYDKFGALSHNRWDRSEITAQDWARIANFSSLQLAWQVARENKQQLLNEQRASLLPHIEQELQTRLQFFISAVENRITLLTQYASGQREQPALCQIQIKQLINALAQVLKRTSQTAEHEYQAQRASLKQVIPLSLPWETTIHRAEQSSEVNASVWFNPLSWGKTRHEQQTVETEYRYVAVSAVQMLLVKESQQRAEPCRQALNQITSSAQMLHELHETLTQILDETDNQNSALQPYRITLEGYLNQLELPLLLAEEEEQTVMPDLGIYGQVSSDGQVETLRQSIADYQAQTGDMLTQRFDDALAAWKKACDVLVTHLHSGIMQAIEQERHFLQEALNNRDHELTVYRAMLKTARQYQHHE